MIELLATFNKAVNPGLLLLPTKMDTPKARAMLWMSGRQESRLEMRYQRLTGTKAKGPARGLWQFELGGGVKGVLNHYSTRTLALHVCAARGIAPIPFAIHQRLEFDDILATAFARLYMWADARALPEVTASPDETWDFYVNCWRPGKPHRGTWDEFHNEAVSLFSKKVV